MHPKNPPRHGDYADGLWTAEVHISHVNQADFPLSSRLWSRERVGTNKFPREHNKTGVEVARRLTVKLFPGETAGKKRKAMHSRSLTGVVLNKLFSSSTRSKPASEFFLFLSTVGCEVLLCCARLKQAEQAEEGCLREAKRPISLQEASSWRLLVVPIGSAGCPCSDWWV